MSMASLTFRLPEEASEFRAAVHALDMSTALERIRSEVFRPSRKHGYQDSDIQQLLEKLGSDGNQLIYLLEVKFGIILQEEGVDGLV